MPLDIEHLDEGQCINLMRFLKDKVTQDSIVGNSYYPHQGFNIGLPEADDEDRRIFIESASAKLLEDIRTYLIRAGVLSDDQIAVEFDESLSVNGNQQDIRSGVLIIESSLLPTVWSAMEEIGFVEGPSLQYAEIREEHEQFESSAELLNTLPENQCLRLINFLNERTREDPEFNDDPDFSTHTAFNIEIDRDQDPAVVAFQSGSIKLLEAIQSYMIKNDLIEPSSMLLSRMQSAVKSSENADQTLFIQLPAIPDLWKKMQPLGLEFNIEGNSAERSRQRFMANKESLRQARGKAEMEELSRNMDLVGGSDMLRAIADFESRCEPTGIFTTPDITDIHYGTTLSPISTQYDNDDSPYFSKWVQTNGPRFHEKEDARRMLDRYESLRWAQENLILHFFCCQYNLKNDSAGKTESQISGDLLESAKFREVRLNPTLCAMALKYMEIKLELESIRAAHKKTETEYTPDEEKAMTARETVQRQLGQMCWELIETISEADGPDHPSIKEKESQVTEHYKVFKQAEKLDYMIDGLEDLSPGLY